jgi:hypothetical protein
LLPASAINGGDILSSPAQEERRQAQEALKYIRQTMESASTFTALSGWGLIAVGGVGLVAASLAWRLGVPEKLSVWVPAALAGVVCAGIANAAKARRLEMPLWSGSFRKVAWVMMPVLAAGGLLTLALVNAGSRHLLPGTWLALYGAGVTAGGTFSLRAVRWMGLALLVLGGLALWIPQQGIVFLAVGFGVMHLLFGGYLVAKHGG